MSADTDLERRLRDGLRARADSFVLAHPDDPPLRDLRPPERRSSRRVAVVAASVALVALGAGLWLSGTGGTAPDHHTLATGPTRSHAPSLAAPGPRTTAPGADGHGLAPYPVQSCPPDVTVPTVASGGHFCGPAPSAGNGSGPDGTCTGQETTAPCGSGVAVGRYYDYTMPGQCAGLITFDGRQWVSELPSAPVPDYDVWMSITAVGTVGYISPTGDVSFVPYTGRALHQCSTSTTAAPAGP